MRVLLFGGSGQLGKTITKLLEDTSVTYLAPSSTEARFPLDTDHIQVYLDFKPTVIINAAAWTNVESAESNEKEVRLVNTSGVMAICKIAQLCEAQLVQVSTDYVFSGSKSTPWLEEDIKSPINVYGRSKSDAEDIVLSELPNQAWIIRTAWLYSQYPSNFVLTILRKFMDKRDPIKIVDDQFGQPTSALDLAETIIQMILKDVPKGIYHGTNSGMASWYTFAKKISDFAGLDSERIEAISSSDYSSKALRPKYTLLSHTKWAESGVAAMENWEIALEKSLPNIISTVSEEI